MCLLVRCSVLTLSELYSDYTAVVYMYQTLLSNFLYAAAIYSCMFPKNEALQISLRLIDVLLCVHYVLVNELYIFCAGNHVC